MTTDKYSPNSDPQSETDSAFSQTFAKAQSTASDVADDVKSQAIEIKDEVKTQATSALGGRKDMAARELTSVAEAMRQTGQALDDQDNGTYAQYSYRMADQVERVSSYLEHKDVGAIVSDAEDFARRQPELFIGGAFTLGLLAARFLKSSASGTMTKSNPQAGHRAYGKNLPRAGNGESTNTWADGNYDPYGSTSTTTRNATPVRESSS